MTRLFYMLLVLLYSLSGPAMGEYSDFGRWSNAANSGAGAADDAAKWIWGQNKGVEKSIRQMDQRGWVPQQVTEAIQTGQQFPATNLVNKANEAIRYVHPQTGQSVVQDAVTKEIIHFGGPGFKY